jgi:hypothetical protein
MLLAGIAPAQTQENPRAAVAPESKDERDLAALVPADALFFVEAPGLSKLFAQGFEHPLVARILASDIAKAAMAEGKVDPREKLAAFDKVIGFEILPTLAALSDRGLELAVFDRSGEPRVLLVARGADAELWEERLGQMLEFVALQTGHAGALSEPAAEIHGADVWYFGRFAIALHGATFFLSNDRALLSESLDLADADQVGGLPANETFAASLGSRALARKRALAWSWADLAGMEQARKRDGSDLARVDRLREIAREPKVQWLLGPSVSAAATAKTWAATIGLSGDRVDLALEAQGIANGPLREVLPHAPPPPLPNPFQGAGGVAGAIFYRDGATLFAKRAELFPPDRTPAFAQALSQLALFFGGMDIGAELLPKLSPWVRVSVVYPEFAAERTPAMRLPGAVVVLGIDDAEKTGFLLEGAFQTAVGLTNVDRAQKGQDGLRLQMEQIGETQVSWAHYMGAKQGEPLDLRFNFEPACARVGQYFVLGSHRALVADAVRALQSRSGKPSSPPSGPLLERISVSGVPLADVLDRNREALIVQAVLDEGKSREKAESDIGGLISLARLVRLAELTIERPSDDVIRVAMALQL